MSGAASSTTPPPADPPAGDGAPGEGEGADSTEEDRIKAIAAAEHSKGHRAGRQTMLRNLGFQTVEEATAFLETARAGQASQGELEQRAAALAAEVSSLKVQVRDLQSSDLITSSLVGAGVKPERLPRAIGLVRSDLAGGFEGATAESVADVVSTLKGDMPELFGAASSPPPPTIPAVGGLNGGTQPPGTNGTRPPGSEGQAEFERRFGKK